MKLFNILRLFVFVMALMTASQASAQSLHCKDTLEHRRLQQAMWESCKQDSQQVVYDACLAFREHALADNDILETSTSWVCGIMYSLGKMNISSAYHIVQGLKGDVENSRYGEEAQYFVSNMMGHVYNTCGNIPGAELEFLKSAELIKGTQYERDGLAFIYLALAHVHLNNDLAQTLYWLDVTEKELNRHKDSWNYYRCQADVNAIKAIVRFKQKDYTAFNQCIDKMESAEKMNNRPSGDLFTPYARIYKTLLDKGKDEALAKADSLPDLKEQYLLKCDIYRYIGDDEHAFMTQRELMHKRDSITGVMIVENIERTDEEMKLMRKGQKMARLMNYILFGVAMLALLTIVLMARNILMRRKYNKRLMAKNQELKTAYKKVAAADEMKSEFIRNVSHEIRTPLNIINGFSQVLAEMGPDMGDKERCVVAKNIGHSTYQITSLVNKMLAIAHDSTKDLMEQAEMTDGVAICRRAIENMPVVDTEKVNVKLDDQTDGDIMLYTNGESLLLMLSYILENSAKFTEKGHIILKVRTEKKKGGKMMLFSVEDTGCGIPSDKQGTIFQRWMKADEFKEGLGLGLAYCWETAQKLGGELTLDQTSEAGTTFTLRLPVEKSKN
jgi:signal transduction histidine kinase